ncbi:MAG: histidine kinase [Candidatus Hinthialibacter antarcticus]|nr:histidine kinase [Candidatus Hinthialibacter antarcticus]
MNRPRNSVLYNTIVVVIFFTLIACATTTMEAFRDSFYGKTPNVLQDFWFSFLGWNSWALTVPVAVWLINTQFSFQKKIGKCIFVILIAATVVVVIKSLLFEYIFNLGRTDWRRIDTFQELVVRAIFSPRLFIEYMIFGFILAFVFSLQYYHVLREREIHSSQLETQLAQAHLNSLQMQLQPHFLFNTLNSISSLLREQVKPEQLQDNMSAADNMITNLSEMFRHTLKSHDQHEAPLRDEFLFLDNYLAIQTIRFSDRLRVEKAIDPKLDSALTPTFLLQPIVENAIRHGISKEADGGVIRIRAQRNGDEIEFVIQDSGSCSLDELQSSEGVGLTNTRKRLQFLYGESHSFQMNKNADGETEIMIRIPYHTEPIQTSNNHEPAH